MSLGALLTMLGWTAGGADWPHFLGPEFNCKSAETGLLKELPPAGPRILWEYEKGAGHSAPAIGDGRVVMFHSKGEDELVDCLDAATGRREWRYQYPAPFTPRYGAGPGPKTNPVIDSNRVFTLGINAILHCLDLKTGAVVWKRDLAADYALQPTFFGQGATPLATDGRVVLSLGTRDRKALVGFAQADGRELWIAKHEWSSSYASPIPAMLHGRSCILAMQGGMTDPPTGGLLAIDAKSGEVLAEVPHRSTMFASVSISSPVLAGDRVFLSEAYTEGARCVSLSPEFKAVTAWRAPRFDTYLMTAVAHGGHLYGFAGQDQRQAELVCYQIETGRELWRDELSGTFQRGSLIQADGAFLCLGENGDLAWLDLSPSGAKIISKAKLFHAGESWTPPAISNGRLYICQNQPGSAGTRPRLICYDFQAGR